MREYFGLFYTLSSQTPLTLNPEHNLPIRGMGEPNMKKRDMDLQQLCRIRPVQKSSE
jgi:hypothetical protein